MMMNKTKIAIIDADGFAYHSLRETPGESFEALDSKIENTLETVEADEYLMFISKGYKYFRHQIFPDYKKIRERYRDRITWSKTLKALLQEGYGARFMIGIEADDLCAFAYRFISTEWKEYEPIMCSPDKDLLQSIPGVHFNYSYRLRDKDDPSSTIKGWWVTTTKEEAEMFVRMQMIVGDTSDGIPGIPKKGIKFWEKMVEAGTTDWTDILRLYIQEHKESLGIQQFQKHYRCLRMLTTPEDFQMEELEPPFELLQEPTLIFKEKPVEPEQLPEF